MFVKILIGLAVSGLVIWLISDEITLWKVFKEKDALETENWDLKRRLILHKSK